MGRIFVEIVVCLVSIQGCGCELHMFGLSFFPFSCSSYEETLVGGDELCYVTRQCDRITSPPRNKISTTHTMIITKPDIDTMNQVENDHRKIHQIFRLTI